MHRWQQRQHITLRSSREKRSNKRGEGEERYQNEKEDEREEGERSAHDGMEALATLAIHHLDHTTTTVPITEARSASSAPHKRNHCTIEDGGQDDIVLVEEELQGRGRGHIAEVEEMRLHCQHSP